MEPKTVDVKRTMWAAILGLILRLFKALFSGFNYPAANHKQLTKSVGGITDAKSRPAERWDGIR